MRLRNDHHPDGLDMGPLSPPKRPGVRGGPIVPKVPLSPAEANKRYKDRQKRLQRELAGERWAAD
jgi:hypothetical protein